MTFYGDIKKKIASNKTAIAVLSFFVILSISLGVIIYNESGIYGLNEGVVSYWDNAGSKVFSDSISFYYLNSAGSYTTLSRVNHLETTETGSTVKTNCYPVVQNTYGKTTYYEETCDYNYGVKVTRYLYVTDSGVVEGFKIDPKDKKVRADIKYTTGVNYLVGSVDKINKVINLGNKQYVFKSISSLVTSASPKINLARNGFTISVSAFSGVKNFEIGGIVSESQNSQLYKGSVERLVGEDYAEESQGTFNIKSLDDLDTPTGVTNVYTGNGKVYVEFIADKDYDVYIRNATSIVPPLTYEVYGLKHLVSFPEVKDFEIAIGRPR